MILDNLFHDNEINVDKYELLVKWLNNGKAFRIRLEQVHL